MHVYAFVVLCCVLTVRASFSNSTSEELTGNGWHKNANDTGKQTYELIETTDESPVGKEENVSQKIDYDSILIQRLLTAMENLGKVPEVCPKDFFEWRDSCYHLSSFSATRDEARQYCEVHHADLVSVNSEKEHQRLLWEFNSPETKSFYFPKRQYRVKNRDLMDVFWTAGETSAQHQWAWNSHFDQQPMTFTSWSEDIDPQNTTFQYADKKTGSIAIIHLLFGGSQSKGDSWSPFGGYHAKKEKPKYSVLRDVTKRCMVYASYCSPQLFQWFTVPCQHQAKFRFICERPKVLKAATVAQTVSQVKEEVVHMPLRTASQPTTTKPEITRKPKTTRAPYIYRVPLTESKSDPPVVNFYGQKDSLLAAYYKNPGQ